MAQRLNRAMEIMGWRVPDEDDQVFDTDYGVQEIAEVREVDFHSFAAAEPAIYEAPVQALPAKPDATVRRIVTVHPSSYKDARLIGEALRDGTPVIMNLTDLNDDEARRLVDFAAGLVFGLHGSIEKVTPRVFLLSPSGVEVAQQTDIRTGNLFA